MPRTLPHALRAASAPVAARAAVVVVVVVVVAAHGVPPRARRRVSHLVGRGLDGGGDPVTLLA
ncbi:hypothetical protein [Streptomyces cuspidosporus]